MGDRGNIAVQGFGLTDARIYLYTHWGGTELEDVLRRALSSPAGQGRLDDPPYLARIIFDVLTEGTHGSETGHGISPRIEDNEHPILVVDCQTQTVRKEGENQHLISEVPISEFIADA